MTPARKSTGGNKLGQGSGCGTSSATRNIMILISPDRGRSSAHSLQQRPALETVRAPSGGASFTWANRPGLRCMDGATQVQAKLTLDATCRSHLWRAAAGLLRGPMVSPLLQASRLLQSKREIWHAGTRKRVCRWRMVTFKSARKPMAAGDRGRAHALEYTMNYVKRALGDSEYVL